LVICGCSAIVGKIRLEGAVSKKLMEGLTNGTKSGVPSELRGPFREQVQRGLKPPLKWAGGKRWQVHHVRVLWQNHSSRRLVEPFCGGLAVTLGLMPLRALLNDINPHVLNFYRWLKCGLTTSLAMENNERQYYEHRQRFNQLLDNREGDGAEAAALFYYLNRTGYNGLCRFNRSGAFNVPFGRYARIKYTSDFTPYKSLFAGWDFVQTDFEAIPLEPGDFVYADPPYDVEFRQYSAAGFSWEQQVRTARWLARHPGPVVLSNQATDRIVELYESLGFELKFLRAPRRISCTGDRTPALEVLAVRNILVPALSPMRPGRRKSAGRFSTRIRDP
jgi:DNA adenine methylase